jgi:pimeloyl-ACP methyl ester carboxylesterase
MDSSNAPDSPGEPPPDAKNDAVDTPRRWVDPADLRGGAQLAVEATVETTRLVESIHAGVLNKLKPGSSVSPKQTRGLTGWIYRTIRRIAQVTGKGTNVALWLAERVAPGASAKETAARDRVVSVLNGIAGDHLAASGNPLARDFSLRNTDGSPIADIDRGDTVVVFVHGLCCSDRDWVGPAERPGHVATLADAVDGTAIFARYNSGLPIAENGRHLSEHLGALFDDSSPSRIVFVTHSMGGLVVRSAARHAADTGARWMDRVTETVYLGTPHRGAPLERIGTWVESQSRRCLFATPIAEVGSVRSRGIQDLGHGADAPDDASAAFLHPPGRTLYVAATLSGNRALRASVGDGLVPLDSALNGPEGESDTPSVTRSVFESTGHLKLLRDPAVTDYLTGWLEEGRRLKG